MSGKKHDLVGMVFGRLTVLADSGRSPQGAILYKCLCICGKYSTVRAGHLRSGATKSCGCLEKESLDSYRTTHGKTGTSTYNCWQSMKWRCSYNTPDYANYAERGIIIDPTWYSFEKFLEDMGERPEGI
jgi:hypothetical protein